MIVLLWVIALLASLLFSVLGWVILYGGKQESVGSKIERGFRAGQQMRKSKEKQND